MPPACLLIALALAGAVIGFAPFNRPVASLFLVAALRHERAFWPRRFVAGWLSGAGFFQLYDGLVQHKVFGLHQIRYGVDLVPYDVVWNVVAAALLAAGIALVVVTGRTARPRR